jgi:20S proteasome subunit beta 1
VQQLIIQSQVQQLLNMLCTVCFYAGWDKHDGGSVYAIPLGGTLLKVPYTIGGSGSAYITGATR